MTGCGVDSHASRLERRTLWTLLAINSTMFVAETGLGWWAESAALVADSLDMAADAAVYAASLYAVGRSQSIKTRAATVSGVLQIGLGLGVLIEVTRRTIYGSEPVSLVMMTVGIVALTANLACLAMLAKHRKGEVHMRASWIFSTNDVIANIGVIMSGLLVMTFGSRVPDLVVGSLVASAVIVGGIRILRQSWDNRESRPHDEA